MQALAMQNAVAMQAATLKATQAAQARSALLQAGVSAGSLRPETQGQPPQQDIGDETTVVVTDIEHELTKTLVNEKTWIKWLDENGYAGSYVSVKYYDAKACSSDSSSLIVRF